VAASVALSSFRDIANGGKHRVIRKYTPQTSDVMASVGGSVSGAMIDPESSSGTDSSDPYLRLKIIRADRSRHRATELGSAAIREWQAFMEKHSVAP
jgi:hypothetical protein